ncbi:hypothetical protein F5Y14DRAFT_447200 [Nemania sp. NC0429]|nr:hypothetical protein F5Y14DRAFT_447200 [Nemania sp. NC0429]
MTYTLSVLYPAGTKFNLDYYLTSHMPLVQKLWAPYGLKSWRVAHYEKPEAPFVIQAYLEWESKEHAEKGTSSTDGATIFADVPQFSDKTPTILDGVLAGSATV